MWGPVPHVPRLVQDTSALVAVAFDTFDDLLEFIGDVLGEGKKSEKLARWHESHESANQRGTSENIDILYRKYIEIYRNIQNI